MTRTCFWCHNLKTQEKSTQLRRNGKSARQRNQPCKARVLPPADHRVPRVSDDGRVHTAVCTGASQPPFAIPGCIPRGFGHFQAYNWSFSIIGSRNIENGPRNQQSGSVEGSQIDFVTLLHSPMLILGLKSSSCTPESGQTPAVWVWRGVAGWASAPGPRTQRTAAHLVVGGRLQRRRNP